MDNDIEPGLFLDVDVTNQVEEPMEEDNMSVYCQTDDVTTDSSTTQTEVSGERFLSVKTLNAEMLQYYTGFDHYDHFKYAFDALGPASMDLKYKSKSLEPLDEFFLTVMKLRQDKDDLELGLLFGGISRRTVSRIFTTWLNLMYYQYGELDTWLDKDIIQEFMPEVSIFFWSFFKDVTNLKLCFNNVIGSKKIFFRDSVGSFLIHESSWMQLKSRSKNPHMLAIKGQRGALIKIITP